MYDHTFSTLSNHQIRHQNTQKWVVKTGDQSVCYATLNGFSWQFQLILSITNIRVLCKFIWVFMVILWTCLLEYQSV